MIWLRTFCKLMKIAAVAVAVLPSLVQAYIPSVSDHIAASRVSDIDATGGLSAHYDYSSGASLATNLVLTTADGVELVRSVAWDYAHLRPLDIAYRVDGSNVASYAYSYVTNDNRIARITAEDGSWWDYGYDSRGRLNAAYRYFSDGTNYPGRLFAYAYDRFGNTIKAGPAPDGETPRYSFNAGGLYNVHTDRQWGSEIDVSGTVATNAKVVVNNVLASQYRNWFNATIPVANQNGPVEQTLHAYAAITNYSAGLDLAIAKTGTVSVAKAQENPAYNAKGEPTADSRFRYVFNAFGWLTSVTNLVAEPASYVAFAYDTGGRRVRKSVYERNGSVWVEKTRNQFYYDGWNLVAETVTDKTATPESTLLRLYTWGLDLAGQRGGRLGQSAGGIGGLLAITEIAGTVTNVYYPVSDHIGTIRGLVDAASGETVAEYEYDPYGVLLGEAGSKTDSCPFRFSGKYYDSETQLLYFGYRYYNPVSTKWLTVDPLHERGGLNFTAYCAGDPVNQVDPLGLRNVVSDGRNVYQESGNWADIASFRNLNAGGFYPACLPFDVALECGIRPLSEWVDENTYDTEFNGILPSGYLPYHRGKGLGSELVAGAYNVVPLLSNILCGGIDGMGGAFAAAEEVCEDVTGCGSAELMMNMYQTGWVPGAFAGAVPYACGVAGNTLRSIVPRVAMSAAIARGPALGSVEAAAIRGGRPLVRDVFIPVKTKTIALVKYDAGFAIRQGAPAYRLWGEGTVEAGRSWTTINPRSYATVDEFKQAAGIGDWVNPPYKIATGRFRTLEGVTSRTALPVADAPNPWLPELRVQPPQSVPNAVININSEPW